MPKGRSHIVHGSLDCCRSQLAVSASRIVGLADGLGKAGKEFGAVDGLDVFEEWVVADVDGVEEFGPSSPGCKPLLVRTSLDGVLAGILSSHAETKDAISCGSGAIAKAGGSCCGTQEMRRLVCSASDR